RPDSSWDNEDEEIDGLDATIIKKYGEGSLEKLRRKKAVNVVESGNPGGHGIQSKLGEQITTSQITDGEGVQSGLDVNKNSNTNLIANPKHVTNGDTCNNKGGNLEVSCLIKDGDTNRKHDEETNLVHDKEVGFHGGNHNSLAEASNGSGHANEDGGHAGNPSGETKTSWRSILGGQAVSNKNLSFYAPTIIEGKPIVHVKSSQFTHIQEQFENLVIGGFVGKKLPFGFVRETLTRTWRLKNNFIMKPYGETMYSFKFMNDDDRKRVLELGSLHITSQLFILRPWKLLVEAEFNDLKTIPIWVVMKRFPMELWDDEGFGRVASTIGKPLFVDKLTESMTRTSYARVCVEIDTKCT
ncbi:Rna exonuclease, partial [Thalictrum thalictroides]